MTLQVYWGLSKKKIIKRTSRKIPGLRKHEHVKRSYTKKNTEYWEHSLLEEIKKKRKVSSDKENQ